MSRIFSCISTSLREFWKKLQNMNFLPVFKGENVVSKKCNFTNFVKMMRKFKAIKPFKVFKN